MGAFFLYKQSTNIPLEKVKQCFNKKGFSDSQLFKIANYNLLLYRKILIDMPNYYEISNDIGIYSVGTVIYKGESYSKSLHYILNDYLNNSFDSSQIIGTFLLIIKNKHKITILVDRTFRQNIFYTMDGSILSSSFLAVISACSGKVSLNRLGLCEVLCTGSLIGPDTLVEQIKRLESTSNIKLSSFEIYKYPNNDFSQSGKLSYRENLESQITYLNNYFKLIKKFGDEFGVLSGLTGGLDSRLLFALIRKHLINYNFYSTWRKQQTLEYRCADDLCRATNENLHTLVYKETLEHNNEQFEELIYKNYYYNDGLVRSHQLWTEEISCREYRTELLRDKRIGFSGVGGEQYRNNERLLRSDYFIEKWIKYELVYKYSNNIFKNTQISSCLIEYIASKIITLLGLKNPNKITRYEIKRYFNEIYNPSNRTIKNNIENQLCFFLSPFTDPYLSFPAYDNVAQKCLAFRLELDLIRAIDPHLAGVQTDYGFSFINGEPFINKVYTLGKNILPLSGFFYFNKMRKKRNTNWLKIENKFPLVAESFSIINNLELGIDLTKLSQNKYLSSLIIDAGYFIKCNF